ncbi:MAG: ribose-phosphate diphosphokinase [Patescibacteria group bacterium]
MRELKLLAGRSHPKLAKEIAKCLDIALCDVMLSNSASGEIICSINESLRGNDVFILQSHGSDINSTIMEQAIMIDAAKRASASSITAVCPILGYARQDRKSGGREPITGHLIVDILAKAGADRIVSVDLHSGQTQGFFDGPFDHLIARPILVEYLKDELKDEDLIIVAPDAGRGKSAERFSDDLYCGMAIIHKHRSTTNHNTVEARYLMGDVAGKTCIVIDDMIDTAGTLCAAADLLMEKGAKQVYGLATHDILSDPAMERIDNSAFKKIFITNTIPLAKNYSKKLIVVSIAPLLADAIRAIYERSSVSTLFGGENQM